MFSLTFCYTKILINSFYFPTPFSSSSFFLLLWHCISTVCNYYKSPFYFYLVGKYWYLITISSFVTLLLNIVLAFTSLVWFSMNTFHVKALIVFFILTPLSLNSTAYYEFKYIYHIFYFINFHIWLSEKYLQMCIRDSDYRV